MCTLFRAEFTQEVSAGFPRLRRIPNTQVIRFLDYLTGLGPAEQDALLDAMAHFNAAAVSPQVYAAEAVERQQHPVFGRLLSALAFRGLVDGYRYTPVKMLSGLVKSYAATGGLDEFLRASGSSVLALQPRPELLPNLDCLVLVKPTRLKKLVDRAFAGLFAPQKVPLGSDACKYIGHLDESRLTVDVLFAPPSRMNPRQLQYLVKVATAADPAGGGATYEGLWSLHAVWDYVTEENAERSVALLAELLVYLKGLVLRVRELTGPGP
jgi:hypothetical protein